MIIDSITSLRSLSSGFFGCKFWMIKTVFYKPLLAE
ncbi:hypothetical protein O185_09735 [Photorhabdus temperata J3]|uniref:Uncharacterized protein n=1 Tax=Photorhabdus temperata J3 TaxID=1389415 RepID=U7R191_PHOTE|nr:hypothetical protein O185_09735 [Photorhabdus temperata J3]